MVAFLHYIWRYPVSVVGLLTWFVVVYTSLSRRILRNILPPPLSYYLLTTHNYLTISLNPMQLTELKHGRLVTNSFEQGLASAVLGSTFVIRCTLSNDIYVYSCTYKIINKYSDTSKT
jgi:hypothetical protein